MGEIHSPSGLGEGTSVSGKDPESIYLLPMHLNLTLLLIESWLKALHGPDLILIAGERTSPVKDSAFLKLTFCVKEVDKVKEVSRCFIRREGRGNSMNKGTGAGKCSVIQNDQDVGAWKGKGGSRMAIWKEARASALRVAFRLTPVARGSTAV